MARPPFLTVCALSMVCAMACGETYFSAGVFVESTEAPGDGDGDGTGDGDGDQTGDGDAMVGFGGADGEDPPPPGSVDLDPLSARPFDYLDCVPPAAPSGAVPPGGRVVSADNIIFISEGQNFLGTFSPVPVSGQDFSEATRVRIMGTPPNSWAVQLVRNSPSAIDAGSVLLADVWARCESPLPGKDVCQALLIVEDAISYDKAVQFPITVGSEWEHFFVSLEAPQDYPVGVGHTTLFLGYSDQTIDIGPVTLRSYGTSREVDDLPATPLTYPGMDPEATWRKAAGARIDDVRRGDIEVEVIGSDGAPVEGAEVRVRMLKHEFLFGSAVSSELSTRNEDPRNSERYIEEVARLFNTVSPFNAMRWKPWAGDWGSGWSKERGAEMVDFAEDRGFAFRGHVLLSPIWSELPEFLEGLASNPPALAQAILDRIDEAMELTRGRAVHWDVMNHPHENRDLTNILGDEVVIDWFERARAGDPDAKLFFSEYDILSDGPGTNGHHETVNHFVEVLAGAPLDGLAFNGNFRHVLTGPEDVYGHLEHFGTALEKEIAISQYAISVKDPNLAACFTHDFMTAVFSHPSVSTFLMWGFWSDDDLIFENDWTQKLSGRVYEDLVLQRWWTDDTLTTDDQGGASVRGFLGDYEITAQAAGKTQSIRLTHTDGPATRATLVLPN